MDSGESSLNEEIKSQTKTMFGYRDKLKTLKKTELQYLLEYNNEEIPPGTDRVFDFKLFIPIRPDQLYFLTDFRSISRCNDIWCTRTMQRMQNWTICI